MKICMPVKENKGLESIAFNHFGSAPLFLIYDLESKELKEINNGDLNHSHGACQPLKAIGGENIDVIFVGGIGAGALTKLSSQGIKVYKAETGTLADNIELLRKKELEEFSSNHSCSHHGCDH